MSSKTRRRRSHTFPDETDERERLETVNETTTDETEDIYDSEQRDEMLADDSITAAEEGFMLGREQPLNKRETRKKAISHDDTTSVELAKQDAEDS